jgi:hypothetical protein
VNTDQERSPEPTTTRSAPQPEQLPTPSLWRVLSAPWTGIVRPRAAAALLGATPRVDMWFVWLLCCLVIVPLVVALSLWGETVKVEYTGREPVLRERTIPEVWHDWNTDGWPDYVGLVCVFLIVLVNLGVLVTALLELPRVHRSGSAFNAFGQCYRGVYGAFGMLVAVLVCLGGMLVATGHAEARAYACGGPQWVSAWSEYLFVTMYLGVPVLALFWASHAVTGVRRLQPTVALPPTCEQCGYNLSFLSTEGRCPECGTPIAESLEPDRARPGPAWESRPSPRTWLRAAAAVAFRPRQFYCALPLRASHSRAELFATCSYILWGACIGLGSYCLRWG